MRHEFRDGVDRKVKPEADWSPPRLTRITVTPDQDAEIRGARNVKAALRSYYRSFQAGEASSWRLPETDKA